MPFEIFCSPYLNTTISETNLRLSLEKDNSISEKLKAVISSFAAWIHLNFISNI